MIDLSGKRGSIRRKSVIFQQSAVPEHAELHLLLSMVDASGVGWSELPTYKEALENVKDKDPAQLWVSGVPGAADGRTL